MKRSASRIASFIRSRGVRARRVISKISSSSRPYGDVVPRALIGDLIARAEGAGWGRIYWMTRENNTAARRLYDSLAERDDFVRYAIAFGNAPRD